MKKKTTEVTEEELNVERLVELERGFVIDAAIVKIMKARKMEKH